MPHAFGGAWTELKLDAVSGYLGFYTDVLKAAPRPDAPFKLWYVDAFAGSGTRTSAITRGGILDGGYVETEELELAGSAKRALAIVPPFQRLVFIEGHRGRFRDLERLRTENPHRHIDCYHGEANAMLSEVFAQPPWSNQREGRGSHRAVVFLDPYGMNVRWKTLELLAATKAVDVWYLFPLEGVNRQLAHNYDRFDTNKQLALDEIFGTTAWRTELYQPDQALPLFDGAVPDRRTVTKRQIEDYAIKRLKTVFGFVSKPLPLLSDDRHLFSLLCLANPGTQAAFGLIQKGVTWVLNKYGPASHRRFDP